MGLWSRLWHRKVQRTGTLMGNKSALDDVLENEPPPLLVSPRWRGVLNARRAAAVSGDLARDVSSAFDALEEAEKRRRDALQQPED
jgi:hypothetical protein